MIDAFQVGDVFEDKRVADRDLNTKTSLQHEIIELPCFVQEKCACLFGFRFQICSFLPVDEFARSLRSQKSKETRKNNNILELNNLNVTS